MSFSSIIKNPLGLQFQVATPVIANIASQTPQVVASVTLDKGLWIVNVNNILATATNNAGGSRINNFYQAISYDGVERERTYLVGTSAVSLQFASIAIIETDGVTPIEVEINVKTSDNGVWNIDDGEITFTRIF